MHVEYFSVSICVFSVEVTQDAQEEEEEEEEQAGEEEEEVNDCEGEKYLARGHTQTQKMINCRVCVTIKSSIFSMSFV